MHYFHIEILNNEHLECIPLNIQSTHCEIIA